MTVSVNVFFMNAAVTLLIPLMVTVQVGLVPAEAQSPPQPAKIERLLGVAVRVTAVPLVRFTPQVDPQLRPPTLEVTVPAAGAGPGRGEGVGLQIESRRHRAVGRVDDGDGVAVQVRHVYPRPRGMHRKRRTECAPRPAVAVTVLVAVSMTETELLLKFVTYTPRPRRIHRDVVRTRPHPAR